MLSFLLEEGVLTVGTISGLFTAALLNSLRGNIIEPIIEKLVPSYKLDTEENFEEIMDEFSKNSLNAFENHFLDNILGRSLNCFDVVNYTIVELCFKYHLDIFGLIKKGLAIDINTLSDVNNLKNK